MKDREAAIYTLMELFEQDGYNNIVLRRAFIKNNEFNTIQKAFITDIVNGTLRNLILLDYIINFFSKTKTKKMKFLILNVLRVSVYQLVFMNKVPVHAVCNEAVDIVKKRGFKGLSGFVNAVLRNIAENLDSVVYPDVRKNFVDYISVKYSYPKWIIEYWLKTLDPQTVLDICVKTSLPPYGVTIAVNSLKINSNELFDILKKDGIRVEKIKEFDELLTVSGTGDMSKITAYKNGFFHIMDKSSFIAVKELNPRKNDYIIDVCAAPGGKSLLCAYFMNNTGKIFARDIYKHKIKIIKDSAERLGINIILPEIKDALIYCQNDFEKADKVIVDAPCSGLGLVRKKPDIKYSKTFEDIQKLSNIQKNILSISKNYVKKGGILLYSTCTISYEENEANVQYFLKNNPDFELISQMQILPQDFDSDGFFIAKFKKI